MTARVPTQNRTSDGETETSKGERLHAMEREGIKSCQCSRFYCSKTKEHTCCALCADRESCEDPCLNHPSKCKLSIQKKQGRPRKLNEGEAFKLWQEGKSDAVIAKAFDVSRQRIQAWRDTLELPATDKEPIDTSKYYLIKQQNGESAILIDRK
jgi:hypothetical protein